MFWIRAVRSAGVPMIVSSLDTVERKRRGDEDVLADHLICVLVAIVVLDKFIQKHMSLNFLRGG